MSTYIESKSNQPSLSTTLPSWAEIFSLSDDDLVKLFETSEYRFTESVLLNTTSVRRIASDAVMKLGDLRDSEPTTMHLLHNTTTIPVLSVQRFFDVHGRKALVMNYMPGRTLEDCWATLGFWQRVKVVWSIRGYIRQLRRVLVPGIPRKNQSPGPVGSEPVECHGPLFTHYAAGPFASYDELTAWFMHKLDVNRRVRKTPTEPMTFDPSLPLVMTHLDLYPNNIILDDAARVWLIDWEHAGFFPQWFEYTMMPDGWQILGSWRYWIVGFMAGFYDRQANFIGNIGWALQLGVFIK